MVPAPRTPHTIVTDPDVPLLKHFVDCTENELIELLRSTRLGLGLPLFTSHPFRVRSILENLIAAGNTQSRHRNIQCALLLRLLIVTVDDTATDNASASSLAWQTYLRCRQHIERNFLQIESVQDAARQCHIERAYLARIFKRFAEEPPSQLIARLKMNRAAELLGNRALLVKEVSEAVGYNDPYHFSRVFKRVYGIPPETVTRAARRNEY
ncbi:MAG: helix-turn-helix transcriptional regulator [Pontiellaceae bacterium]|nr:helix-turn-helix transcriptional regulator [Pontiellaceae bacterium]MBN2786314.1 helix-turn-helix transcriptional regulator [Pontiellaceae bacterium]